MKQEVTLYFTIDPSTTEGAGEPYCFIKVNDEVKGRITFDRKSKTFNISYNGLTIEKVIQFSSENYELMFLDEIVEHHIKDIFVSGGELFIEWDHSPIPKAVFPIPATLEKKVVDYD